MQEPWNILGENMAQTYLVPGPVERPFGYLNVQQCSLPRDTALHINPHRTVALWAYRSMWNAGSFHVCKGLLGFHGLVLLLVLYVPKAEFTGEGRAAQGPLSILKVLVGILHPIIYIKHVVLQTHFYSLRSLKEYSTQCLNFQSNQSVM